MSRKLTILIEDSVYEGLHRVAGRGSISKFIENLARPLVAQHDMGAQYREAAWDAAREREAREWTEGLIESVDETRQATHVFPCPDSNRLRSIRRVGTAFVPTLRLLELRTEGLCVEGTAPLY